MDDRSHLALFWDLTGLRGAQVRRSEKRREFAHARRNAYLYFGTRQQATEAASHVRGNARVRMAFPQLRVQQTHADDLIRRDYVRPDHHEDPDEGLPPPGWPLGLTWMAHVGQPVQGPLGGILTPADGNYREVVEVTARTGQYDAGWHQSGIPGDFARHLSGERSERTRLLRGRTDVQTIAYLGLSYRGVRPADILDQVYQHHRRTGVGVGYPVPPPKPRDAQMPARGHGTENDTDEADDADNAGNADGADGAACSGAAAPTMD